MERKEELGRSLIMESGSALVRSVILFIESGVLQELGKRSWCQQEAFALLSGKQKQLEKPWIK